MTMSPRRLSALALACALLTAACGSDDADSSPAADPTTDPTAATTAAMDHDAAPMDHGDHGEHADDHAHGTGHEDELAVTYDELPGDVRAQVDLTKAYVEQYATAADAERDGWRKATLSLNGIGAHYLQGDPTGFLGMGYEFDPTHPNVLLFDGEGPDAKIAGASFILTDPDPQGYPGELDVWHHHYGVCFDPDRLIVIGEIDGHEGSTISMTVDQCEAEGALAIPIENLYMIHVWVAPGYIDDGPVFAHDHPQLYDGITAAEQL